MATPPYKTTSYLQSAANSAQSAGLSLSKGPAQQVQSCPYGNSFAATQPNSSMFAFPAKAVASYEPCELQQLTIVLEPGGASAKSIVVSKVRTGEKVNPSVAKAYQPNLHSYDLVIESLSGIRIDTSQSDINSIATNRPVKGPVTPAGDSPSLKVRATAKDKTRHVSWHPLHPSTSIGYLAVADAGKEASSQIHIPHRDGFIENFISIWPFSSSRTVLTPIRGSSCGHSSQPNPITGLSALLVTMPEEQWTLTIGGNLFAANKKGWSGKKSQNLVQREGKKGSGVWGATTTTTTTYSGRSSETWKETVKTGKDYKSYSATTRSSDGLTITDTETTHGQKYTESQKRTADSDQYIGWTSVSATKTDSTESDPTAWVFDDNESYSEAFTIKVKSAGQTSQFNPGKIVNTVIGVAKIVTDISSALKNFQVGWSLSVDISMLDGSLDLQWGTRWPSSYFDDNRVYYIERYLSAKGDLSLFKAKVDGAFGIDFDSGWLPAGVMLQIFLALTLGLGIAPQIAWVYTNPDKKFQGNTESKTELKGEASLEFGVRGTARAFGYSAVLKGTLNGKISAKGTAIFDVNSPPYVKAGWETDGLKISGYFETTDNGITSRREMDPFVIFDPYKSPEKVFWK